MIFGGSRKFCDKTLGGAKLEAVGVASHGPYDSRRSRILPSLRSETHRFAVPAGDVMGFA
jgi:hypothetical protein